MSEKVVTEELTAEDMGAVSVSLDDDDAEREAKEEEERTPPDLSALIPLGNFLVIWPTKPPKHGGKVYLIEGSVAERDTQGPPRDEGLVLASGPDCKIAKEGDYVFYWKHAGSWQYPKGKKGVRILKETEIYAKRALVK